MHFLSAFLKSYEMGPVFSKPGILLLTSVRQIIMFSDQQIEKVITLVGDFRGLRLFEDDVERDRLMPMLEHLEAIGIVYLKRIGEKDHIVAAAGLTDEGVKQYRIRHPFRAYGVKPDLETMRTREDGVIATWVNATN